MDTIFALATAFGKAGVAVLRVSGPQAYAACAALAGATPAPGRTSLRKLYASDGTFLDQALVLAFAQGRSFTGEPVVEFQCHGAPAIIAALLAELGKQPGLRLAEPGEFTRRAMENGCLDLAQVEGLADLIDAETEAQRKQALRVFSGELGTKTESWRANLVRAAALLEATIDFADEDVPEDVSDEVLDLIEGTLLSLSAEIAGSAAAERVRTGFEVAIVGAPNVGKSTLLNALAGREAAITSEFAGTTRDVIEVRMDLAGLPVTILDTAGLRETTDHVEGIGIERAKQRAMQADLRVFLGDATDLDLQPETQDIVLRPKIDTDDGLENGISGKTGHGVSLLVSQISAVLATQASGAGLATRARHRQAMERAVADLQAAIGTVRIGPDMYDLAAENLRNAIRTLESLVGRIDVETVLDEIFSSFCLGK